MGNRPHTDCRAEGHQRTADQAAQNAGDKRDAPPTSRKASRSASLRRDGKPTSRKTTRSTSPRRNTSCGSGTGHRRDHSRSEHPRESDGRARERGRRASRSRSRERQHSDMKRSRQYMVCTSRGRGSGQKGNELCSPLPSPPSPGLSAPSPSPPRTQGTFSTVRTGRPGATPTHLQPDPPPGRRWDIWVIPLMGPRFVIWVEGNPLANELAECIARKSTTPQLLLPITTRGRRLRGDEHVWKEGENPPHW